MLYLIIFAVVAGILLFFCSTVTGLPRLKYTYLDEYTLTEQDLLFLEPSYEDPKMIIIGPGNQINMNMILRGCRNVHIYNKDIDAIIIFGSSLVSHFPSDCDILVVLKSKYKSTRTVSVVDRDAKKYFSVSGGSTHDSSSCYTVPVYYTSYNRSYNPLRLDIQIKSRDIIEEEIASTKAGTAPDSCSYNAITKGLYLFRSADFVTYRLNVLDNLVK